MPTNATADFKIQTSFSNAPVSQFIVYDAYNSVGGYLTYVETGSGVAIGGESTSPQYLRLSGTFHANAATGGTLDFQWAQGTTNVYDTKLLEGSWMRISKMHDET
jgi:hypothetical protein